MYLDELSSKELKKKINKSSVVILPIGAVESHGNHLPLNTDSLQPEFIAKEIAERLNKKFNKIFIAPPLRYGICSSTKNFFGTITISFESLKSIVYDILSELARNGFRKIVVLSGHAGILHMSALRYSAEKVVNEKNVKIIVLSDYDIAYELSGKEFPKDDGHAGTIETSRILAIKPNLVKEKGKKNKANIPKFFVLRDVRKYWKIAINGNPEIATKEKGKFINDYIVKRMIEIINSMNKY